MAGPALTFVEKMRGKRTRDIELPNESGQVDPRLKPYRPGGVRDALKKAGEGVKVLRDKGLIGKRSPGGKR